MAMKTVTLITLVFLSGCSLISDFSGYHFVKPAQGGDGGSEEADGGTTLEPSREDSGMPEHDAGMAFPDPGTSTDSGLGMDASAMDSGQPIVADAGSDAAQPLPPDAGTDAGPVYPHGCAPPTQWCSNLQACFTKMQLDYNNGSCHNCTRNNTTGEWACQ